MESGEHYYVGNRAEENLHARMVVMLANSRDVEDIFPKEMAVIELREQVEGVDVEALLVLAIGAVVVFFALFSVVLGSEEMIAYHFDLLLLVFVVIFHIYLIIYFSFLLSIFFFFLLDLDLLLLSVVVSVVEVVGEVVCFRILAEHVVKAETRGKEEEDQVAISLPIVNRREQE